MCGNLIILTHSLPQPCEGGTIITSILLRRKLLHRQVKLGDLTKVKGNGVEMVQKANHCISQIPLPGQF